MQILQESADGSGFRFLVHLFKIKENSVIYWRCIRS